MSKEIRYNEQFPSWTWRRRRWRWRRRPETNGDVDNAHVDADDVNKNDIDNAYVDAAADAELT